MRKTVLITGASRGIGRACALLLDDKSLNVVINYKKEKEKAQEVVDQLRQKGLNAISIQADISDFKQVQQMFNTIEDSFGSVDILVNNAGISSMSQCQDVSLASWKDTFSTNVDGLFYCTKLAIPKMISNKYGIIVNVASIWGQTGAPMESHYGATKGAVIAYTKSLARELGPSNIRVNAVSPGCIDTDMLKGVSKRALEAFAQEVPLGRLGRPEEVGQVIKFLISDQASYITGQVINVNGGYLD
ncbi:MAG: 3-oxoacyl-ACP reductase FabG [Tissierellia bacterium]|nr:3-oxoacyl-ACP reductase FabG [Tissierellia bacterium]